MVRKIKWDAQINMRGQSRRIISGDYSPRNLWGKKMNKLH